MKIAIVVLLFAASALAQTPNTRLPVACGQGDVSFKVKLDDTQNTLAQPEAGKALVYFIQEKGMPFGPLVTRIGLDGAWVGAGKNSSYFSVSVEPGEHHVCASVQSVQSYLGHPVGFLHFKAEAGKVYYFNARVISGESTAYLFFGAEDSDQAKYQIATFPLSVSSPKK